MSNSLRFLMLPAALFIPGAALAGCGGGEAGITEREIIVNLGEQGPAGTTGTVSLSASGEQTIVAIDVIVPAGGGQQGAGIYSGTCDNVGDKVHEIPPLEEGTQAITLDADIQSLFDEPHTFVVTKTPASDEVIACGNIEE
jgi:hypothetical protein